MYKLLLFYFLFLGFSLQAQTNQTEFSKDKPAKEVAKWLSGAFQNQQQAKADSDFFEIHLHIQPIWPKLQNGYWLYVEQAMASALSKPYRQRIYRVYSLTTGEVISEVFSIKDPLRFAGAWKETSLLDKITPDSLLPRTGCEVIMKKEGKTYVGATGKQTCPSELRGAKYASSEVILDKKQLRSWDRGYDANDKQVWGATKSGYIFDKAD